MLALYSSKKDLKEAVGQSLNYQETSMFGNEYKADGTFAVCNRPSITGIKGREFFAEVTIDFGPTVERSRGRGSRLSQETRTSPWSVGHRLRPIRS